MESCDILLQSLFLCQLEVTLSYPLFVWFFLILVDVPGIDGKNYKGDEMALLMHGLLPADVDFKVFGLTHAIDIIYNLFLLAFSM